MSLSLDKLHSLLNEKGFIPVNHFQYHGMCRYIEVACKENAEHFLLTISSRFEMSSHGKGFALKSIPVDSSGLIPEKYARLPSNFEISNLYEEIGLSKSDDKESIEKQLMEGYKKTIQLDNTVDGNLDALKENFNQLKRLEQCVGSLEYRLAIFHKVWLSVLNKENEVECYMIKDYTPETIRKFMVTIDLEGFIQSAATIATDVERINLAIAKIIDKNINTHTNQFYTAIKNCPVLANIVQQVQIKRRNYAEMVDTFRNLFEYTKVKEKEILAKLNSIATVKEGNIYSDMDNARIRSNLEREIQKVLQSRQEVMANIMKIKQRDRSLVLTIDRILFDNIVMLSTVNRNLTILSALCS